MSYTTTNRFGDVLHSYHPANAGVYVKGMWFPDYGPGSMDFSEQYKKHPTSTIFRNQMSMPNDRKKLMEKQEAELASPNRSTSAPALRKTGMGAEQPLQQFRRPDPANEALRKSVDIQPYPKKGGHLNPKMESRGYQANATREPPTLSTHMEQFQTIQLDKSMPSLTMGPRTLAAELGSPARSQRIYSGLGRTSLPGDGETPHYVARNTIISRPADAAGVAGSTRFRHHDRHSVAGQCSPVSLASTVRSTMHGRSMNDLASENMATFIKRFPENPH